VSEKCGTCGRRLARNGSDLLDTCSWRKSGFEKEVDCLRRGVAAAEERGRRRGVEEMAKLRDALQVIAAGSSGYRGGGGYFCNWCDGAGSEEFADRHPDRCPRTIARKVLAALAPRDSAPARYCDEPHPDRPLRCGRFVKHDGPHTAFVPGFEDEQRAAVHWEDRK